jgi:hypothetical protein
MRKTWIKLYVDQCLHGSMIEELNAEQRWLWIGLLLLAGESSIPGIIFRRKNADGKPIGFSGITIAEMLDVNIDVYVDGIKRMINKEKISIDKTGVIHILNWEKYQSEYQRQKRYRYGYRKNCNFSDDIDTETDTETDTEKKKAENTGPLFEELWKSWPSEGRFKKKHCQAKFAALCKAGKLDEFRAAHRGYLKYLEYQERERNFKQNAMYLSTFFNNWESDKERYFGFDRGPRL